MKRAQLIEWGIIVIALIFGYKFFEAIITFFIQLIYGFDGRLIVPDVLRALLAIGLYIACFAILIKNSDKIAQYMSRAADPSANELAVKIGKRSMLQVILIAICITTILSGIADIIYYVFEMFKTGVQRRGFEDPPMNFLPGQYVFIVKVIQLILAVIVIVASKNISELLIRKSEADELVFDSKPEN